MTIKEFVKKLERKRKQKKARFRFISISGMGIEVATRHKKRCPIEFVAGTSDFVDGAKKLGLTDNQMWAIINAADKAEPTRLRKQLLCAVGLKEAE